MGHPPCSVHVLAGQRCDTFYIETISEEHKMNARQFDEFVKREQQQSVSFNPEFEKEEWLRSLDALYTRIESFLQEYISSGEVKREYRPVDLTEEYIGSYAAKEMVLSIGRRKVRLTPVGTFIIGAKGRVDLTGPNGSFQIMLVDSKVTKTSDLIQVTVTVGNKSPKPKSPEQPKDIQWEWKTVTRPPERRFIELTQEVFFELVMEAANG
jgi:hypothetical protein